MIGVLKTSSGCGVKLAPLCTTSWWCLYLILIVNLPGLLSSEAGVPCRPPKAVEQMLRGVCGGASSCASSYPIN